MSLNEAQEVQDVIDRLGKAVIERGADFVYPAEWRINVGYSNPEGMCLYELKDGTRACIIGLSWPHIPKPSHPLTSAVEFLELEYNSNIALDCASLAQELQDQYCNWGECFVAAVKQAKSKGFNPTIPAELQYLGV